MLQIKNPVLPGFNADPSIIRVDDNTGPDDQTATYRQSLGTADNSGDDTLYEDTQVILENNATLKGQDQRYTLALWTDGTYTYSLRLSSGLSADAWQALLDGPAP